MATLAKRSAMGLTHWRNTMRKLVIAVATAATLSLSLVAGAAAEQENACEGLATAAEASADSPVGGVANGAANANENAAFFSCLTEEEPV